MASGTYTEIVSGDGFNDFGTKSFALNKGKLGTVVYVSDEIGTSSNAEININAALGWNFNAAVIHQIVVTASASTDFDVEIYPNDNFGANTYVYQNLTNNLYVSDRPNPGLIYLDEDGSREMHLKIINDDGSNASTFTVRFIVSAL